MERVQRIIPGFVPGTHKISSWAILKLTIRLKKQKNTGNSSAEFNLNPRRCAALLSAHARPLIAHADRVAALHFRSHAQRRAIASRTPRDAFSRVLTLAARGDGTCYGIDACSSLSVNIAYRFVGGVFWLHRTGSVRLRSEWALTSRRARAIRRLEGRA